ncbi:MAG TPA: FAD-dependent oxidoreductase [Ktedonobacterales bacterium]
MEILILGAGVSGLTTGICLLEAGHRARMWAAELPPATTSNVAAAVWYPYRAWPIERVAAWGAATYEAFEGLCGGAESGVIQREVIELMPRVTPEDPWWRAGVRGFRRLREDERAPGYPDGWSFQAPVIDTTVYLDYLVGRFTALGGQIERRHVADLTEPLAACDVVINCTGLGARDLLGDTAVHPARGQVVSIPATGFGRVLLDDHGPNAVAYIVPRVHDIILGGTDSDDDDRLTADPSDTRSILSRCASIVEHLDAAFAAHLRALATGDPTALTVKVGLRPVRETVRLEREEVAPGKLVVHNYGHGGAGITLSWGCAREAAALATS